MAGRMPSNWVCSCLEVAQMAMENIGSVDLALEAAGFNQGLPPIPEPRGTTGPSKARPAWLKPAPGKKDEAA